MRRPIDCASYGRKPNFQLCLPLERSNEDDAITAIAMPLPGTAQQATAKSKPPSPVGGGRRRVDHPCERGHYDP